jgi:hypothetical protein
MRDTITASAAIHVNRRSLFAAVEYGDEWAVTESFHSSDIGPAQRNVGRVLLANLPMETACDIARSLNGMGGGS